MEKLVIKTASVTEIPLIRQLAEEIWPGTYIPIIGEAQVCYMLDRFYSSAALDEQMRDGHKFIIGYVDSFPVGFAAWSLIEHNVYKLHKLYILQSVQGNGYGKAMIGYIKDDIRTLGANALRLNVNRYNQAAISFYEKTGFTLYKTEDIDIGNGFFMNDYILTMPI